MSSVHNIVNGNESYNGKNSDNGNGIDNVEMMMSLLKVTSVIIFYSAFKKLSQL